MVKGNGPRSARRLQDTHGDGVQEIPPLINLLEHGYDVRTVRELLGRRDVKTAMIYTHVLNRGGQGVRSPIDSM